MDIDRYLDRLTSQHADKPNLRSHLTAILSPLDAAHTVAKDLPGLVSLDSATGVQLDILGVLTGASRQIPDGILPAADTYLDDDTFRQLIRMRVLANQWDGTAAGLEKMRGALEELGFQANYIDNQDMTMSIEVSGNVSDTVKALVMSGQALPKPMGVTVTVTADEAAYAEEYYAASVYGVEIVGGTI